MFVSAGSKAFDDIETVYAPNPDWKLVIRAAIILTIHWLGVSLFSGTVDGHLCSLVALI